jgi:hypothetical protein
MTNLEMILVHRCAPYLCIDMLKMELLDQKISPTKRVLCREVPRTCKIQRMVICHGDYLITES